MFLVSGCQELPKSTWPVTARGAQPEIETSPLYDAAQARKIRSPKTGSPSAQVDPITPSFDAYDAADDIDTLISESPVGSGSDSDASSLVWPGIAAGISSPIHSPYEGAPMDGSVQDPTTANGSGGIFDSRVDGDDPTFGEGEGFAVEQLEPRICFKDDIMGLPSMFWNDAKSIVTWPNAIVLGAAAAGAVWIRDDLDQKVRYETAEHPLRWGEGSVVLRQFGEYSYQVPVLAGIYGLSLWTQNDHLHEFSMAAFSAYGLTALSTVAIKGATNTTRPTAQFEYGHYGFPSYHAASTFSLAAVVDEYYGWQLGLPAYALAGLVGWSRIDQREHDLSDVLFGSVLGLVIGKSVAAAHLDRRANMKITPYYDAQNRAAAVSFEKRF